ncbi:glycosyltransferase family 2 protein [Shewanella gelidimarina]|uniref:glycosyltransferase family 2 protein n=1 Tax=Shewanella gelidimarina TaxID=56813 RepID=UPI00200F96F6|nr:glycosyltransferase family 2 protein [Shewanella gelidimarina]MCL1057881.1 glycosyltransferase family 2 protein [Shewanella gelidimarina]
MINKKISVLIPVYNEEKYISDCIYSILNSIINAELEIIIVDDMSTDDTFQLVCKIQLENPGVIKLHKTPIKGKVNAFNFAYEQSEGDFIVFIGGDDLLAPNVLQSRIDVITSTTSPMISLCKIRTFSENKDLDNITFPKGNGGAKCGGAMLMNKKLAKIAFPIPNTLPNEDTWFKAFIDFYPIKVAHINDVGLLYRQHENNSIKLQSSFENFSHNLNIRHKAYEYFINRFTNEIVNQRKIKQLILSESLRMNNDFFKILLTSLSFKEKLSYIVHSNKFFYLVKLKLYKVLSGRL